MHQNLDPRPSIDRSTVEVPTALAVGATLGIVCSLVRLPTSTWDTLYAEDGKVFLQAWVSNPSLHLPIDPYDGYLHFWPRLISGIISLLPVDTWPTATTVAFGSMVGLIGGLSFLISKSLITSPILRLLVMIIPILLPFAGVEALGNLANLHWYFLYLGFWISWHSPRTYSASVVWSLTLAMAAMTEIQLAILAPIIAGRAWKGTRYERIVFTGWSVGIVAQLVAFLSSDTTRTSRGLADPLSMIRGLLVNVVLGTPVGNQPRANFLIEISGWLVPVTLAIAIAALLAASAIKDNTRKWVIISATLTSITTWALSFLLNNHPGLDYIRPPFTFIRWGTGASLLLWVALVIALDVAASHSASAKKLVPTFTAIALILSSLISPATVNTRHGAPSWSQQVANLRQRCESQNPSRETVVIDHAPEGWQMILPCDRLMPRGYSNGAVSSQ